MKLREIFRFEFAYQVRRAWPWLIFTALVVFAFLMTRDGRVVAAFGAIPTKVLFGVSGARGRKSARPSMLTAATRTRRRSPPT